ncbi:MAG: DUF3253 domain-containing protein [Rhodovarius sp.]|nr:DUF3253 domain-containing protein [Rhodovarius sp.]
MTGSAEPSPEAIAAEILRQAAARGPGRSLCPSEVARALHTGPEPEGWRRLLPAVRQAAAALAAEGRIAILRKGKPIPPAALRGVIRLALPQGRGQRS